MSRFQRVDGAAKTLALPFHWYKLNNPHNTPAQVIAFPTHLTSVNGIGEMTRVHCV